MSPTAPAGPACARSQGAVEGQASPRSTDRRLTRARATQIRVYYLNASNHIIEVGVPVPQSPSRPPVLPPSHYA